MITIIILLILAGISIAQVTGNGLFEKAKIAKEESQNAQEKEKSILDNYENNINNYRENSDDIDALSARVKALEDSSFNKNYSEIYTGSITGISNLDISNYNEIRICFMYDNSQYDGWINYTKSLLITANQIKLITFYKDTHYAMLYLDLNNNKLSYNSASSAFKGGWTVTTFSIRIEGR